MAAGLDPEAFWKQTPRTFVAIMEGKRRAAETAHDERMELAWITARLGMMDPKRFPKLKTLLSSEQREQPPQQTPQQMLAAMRAWTGATRH